MLIPKELLEPGWRCREQYMQWSRGAFVAGAYLSDLLES
jgi:hypothetical protein